LRRLREQAGLSQADIADSLTCTRQAVSQWERRGQLPDGPVVAKLDTLLAAGGELHAVWRLARLAKQAKRDGTNLEVMMDPSRRQFGLSFSLAAVLAAADVASEEMATADPTPRQLGTLEADTRRIRAGLNTTAPKQLLAEAVRRWDNAKTWLGRDVSGPVRARLVLVAGQLTTTIAWLGRNLNQPRITEAFGDLAGQYATRSGNPLLIGRVAALRTVLAIDVGEYDLAAEHASTGRRDAHPSQRARLAGYSAEALGASGRRAEAEDALLAMRANLRGASGFGEPAEQLFTSLTLAGLGDPDAFEFAARAADWYGDDADGVGLARVTAGRGLLLAARPDPAAAAHEGLLALQATATVTNADVSRRASDLHRDLASRWSGVAEVRQLGHAVAEARAGLAV